MLNIFIIMVVASASLFSAVALEGGANPANAEKESSRQSVLVRDSQQDVAQDKQLCVAQQGDSVERRSDEAYRLCQEIARLTDETKLGEEPIENKSFPLQPKLEESRLAFLEARKDYRDFYYANATIIDETWKLEGQMMGVNRVHGELLKQHSDQAARVLRAEYSAVDGKRANLCTQHKSLFQELRRLRCCAEACMIYFVAFASDHMGENFAMMKTEMWERIGFNKDDSVLKAAAESSREWCEKVSF